METKTQTNKTKLPNCYVHISMLIYTISDKHVFNFSGASQIFMKCLLHARHCTSSGREKQMCAFGEYKLDESRGQTLTSREDARRKEEAQCFESI